MSTVAIVILNFNGKDFLAQFIPTLIRNSRGHEIIVADNGSHDDSVVFLKKEFPEVRLILLDKNYGFPGGYNEALSQVKSDFYVIINSDIEVTQQWLDPMIEFMESHDEYAAVQPKILDFKKKSCFEYAGASGGFIDSLGYPYCRGRIFSTLEEDHGQYDDPIDVFWTSGACMMIRALDFHGVGGFDASFFAHMEEIDLCWRLHAHNRKLACIPQSQVFHVGGGTLSASHPYKTYLNFRNGLYLLAKNLPFVQLWKIPVRMSLDIISGFRFWNESGFRHFIAILRAHFHFVSGFIRVRRSNSQARKLHINSQVRSIVFSHFLLGIRTFDQLSGHHQ